MLIDIKIFLQFKASTTCLILYVIFAQKPNKSKAKLFLYYLVLFNIYYKNKIFRKYNKVKSQSIKYYFLKKILY